MIFSNTFCKSEPKEMEFGTIHQIILGESGRGRKEIRLTCPENTVIQIGGNKDLSIGQTKSGRPRIVQQRDEKTYLLLSTRGGYTRRGNGWVGAWKENKATYKVLAKGNGADGAAGRIGYWDVMLLELVGEPSNDWLRIRTSGGGYGTSPQWVSISQKGISLFDSTDDAVLYADSQLLDFPDYDEDGEIKDVFKDIIS